MREQGVLTLSKGKWSEAKRRRDVIAQLAKLDFVGRSAAEEAAAQLGISRRRLYELIKQFRSGSGLVTDLAVNHSNGGKGKARLSAEIERIITDVIQDLYLSRQKLSEAVVLREISRRCRLAGKRAPARNTIRRRIEQLDPVAVTRKRHGEKAARALQSAAGIPPQPSKPLDLVQMDHSPMDVIVVEKESREPIGRPYLTLAIDVFTRSIIGMLLTLEAPSATSVGLCLAHAVTNKAAWLERLGVSEASWPMTGKPVNIYVDNGSDFHSEALERGCEQHGIKLDFRPGGLPHFGGIIERVIGSAMTMAHQLPGTTFSNTQERGSYDSEAAAIFTLRELEKWLALAICTYHESVHGALWEPPIAVWKRSIQTTPQFTVSNEKAFLVDFLPVIRRQMNRVGLIIDHITYYADSFKPWIARRHSLGKFVIRRDSV